MSQPAFSTLAPLRCSCCHKDPVECNCAAGDNCPVCGRCELHCQDCDKGEGPAQ